MEPKIYPIDVHCIPPNRIDHHAFYILEKLRQSGFIAYLVGGSVRDLLLNTRPKDFDIATSAKPEEIRKIFGRNCILIGRRFRLAHIRFGKKIIEVATFRSGDIEEKELIIRDNIFGSPEEDALRRDFTINALFYDPVNQTVIDYVEGFPDVLKKTLRCIGNAHTRFTQDPVRMIRMLKFIARFQFDVEEKTHTALLECKDEISKSSHVRILEEIFRMLESGSAKPFFQLLNKYQFLPTLFPILAKHFSEDDLVYQYLHEADIHMKKNLPDPLDRSVLIAFLLFPLLRKKLLSAQRHYHLGAIAEETMDLIQDVFDDFFLLPKKIKSEVTSILVNQFRFTPLNEKNIRRPRVPHDPLFFLSMQFFKIRCMLEKEHYQTYLEWNEAVIATHTNRQKT